jgi:hypothetical protein
VKSATVLTREQNVRGIQNWINAIGFDAWEGRNYRSLELLGGMSIEVFQPDQYCSDSIRKMCGVVVQNRDLVVVDELGSRATGLESGRLLGHRFGETTCTAEPREITGGFFDEYDVPTWDTWVEFVESDDLAKQAGPYLVAWVPEELTDSVGRAIDTSFEANIFWLP